MFEFQFGDPNGDPAESGSGRCSEGEFEIKDGSTLKCKVSTGAL